MINSINGYEMYLVPKLINLINLKPNKMSCKDPQAVQFKLFSCFIIHQMLMFKNQHCLPAI